MSTCVGAPIQCYVEQLRELRHEEQQLPPHTPESLGESQHPAFKLNTEPIGRTLTSSSLQEAVQALTPVVGNVLRTESGVATGSQLSGMQPTGSSSLHSIGSGMVQMHEHAVTERQQLTALQRLFSAVMEDFISHMSGCDPSLRLPPNPIV